jgi:predicted Zn-dependent protease
MYEVIIILIVSLILYLLIRRLPYFKDSKVKKIKTKRFEFNWFSIRRKSRAFFRNSLDSIKSFFAKKTAKSSLDDGQDSKKERKVDVDKSFQKAEKIFEEGDVDTAEKIVIRLIQIKPSDPKLYYLLHKIYLEQGNVKEAALSLKEAIKRKEDGFWLVELAEIYQRLKKYQLSEKALKESIKANNTIALRWSKLAQVQSKLGKDQEALDSINRALEIEPNNQNYKDIKRQVER